MPLKPSMTLKEAKEFLQGDLKQSIENDIRPILQPEKEEGGYFGVTVLVLCYVEFLGALYDGKKGGNTTNKSVRFIKEVLGSVDSQYRLADNARLLHDMYRHGTVHLYAPKVLKSKRSRRELRWFLYKGHREARKIVDRRALKLRHMQPIESDAVSDWLPVSINCLYDDLRAAIDEFCALLDADKNGRLEKWRQTADALCDPELTSLTWSTERSACPPPAGQRP